MRESIILVCACIVPYGNARFFPGISERFGTAGEFSVNQFYLTKRNRIAGFDSDAFRPNMVFGLSQERISDTDG